jgi:hypothetical protein
MNASIDMNNNNANFNDEDDYGFFCEFDQTIPTDKINYVNHNKIKLNKLKNWENKYKYTILKPNLLPMIQKIPTYYNINLNLYKQKSPKVMPILDNETDYCSVKDNNLIKTKILMPSIFIISLLASIILLLVPLNK